MPRRPRLFVDGALYHVYCRTARGERVFTRASEAGAFLEILRDVVRRDELTVLAWCLMPTHYHLLVRTSHVPLWRSMRLIQGRSAQTFNRRHRQIGSLWQERYKAKLVTDAAYFGTVVAYIHLNPVAAGVAKHPVEYRWCGHREVLGEPGYRVLDVNATLSLFGATQAEARRKYAAALAALRRKDEHLLSPGGVPWWGRAAGTDEGEEVTTAQGPRLDVSGASSGRDRWPVEPKVLLARACAALGIELGRLESPRRDRTTAQARDLICLLAVERYGVKTRELAELLGRTPDQLSRWTGRGSARKAHDPEFALALDSLDARLSVEPAGVKTQPIAWKPLMRGLGRDSR